MRVNFNSENKDDNGWFDSSTNFRYTPLEAGTYVVFLQVYVTGDVRGNHVCLARIYKNTTLFANGTFIFPQSDLTHSISHAFAMVDMNGSTDYIEFKVYSDLVDPIIVSGAANTLAWGYKLK